MEGEWVERVAVLESHHYENLAVPLAVRLEE